MPNLKEFIAVWSCLKIGLFRKATAECYTPLLILSVAGYGFLLYGLGERVINIEVRLVSVVWLVVWAIIIAIFYLFDRKNRHFRFKCVGYYWRGYTDEQGVRQVYENPYCSKDGREMVLDDGGKHICPKCGDSIEEDYSLMYGTAQSEARAEQDGFTSLENKEYVSSVVFNKEANH